MPTLPDHEIEALDLLERAFGDAAFGRIAAVSSFGAESAVLLHLLSRIERSAPVLFIDTGMLFEETLAYKRELIDFLGLTDVGTIRPAREAIAATDPWGRLHRNDADACCRLRKSAPLELALEGFDGWATGRKRHQAATRVDLPLIERDVNGRIKLNPLAGWHAETLSDYARRFDLPQHPLVRMKYASIGCACCTSAVEPGEDSRAGRWRGTDKVECGIHFENGRVVRTATPAPL